MKSAGALLVLVLGCSASREQPPTACPLPVVYCDAAPPVCPAGTFPAATDCLHGSCPSRCWTGDCVPCESACVVDSDCFLGGRHGCCDLSAGDCVFAIARSDAERDACYAPRLSSEPPPRGCTAGCVGDDPRCVDCPHCIPDRARCEGGRCVSVWDCAPTCTCI